MQCGKVYTKLCITAAIAIAVSLTGYQGAQAFSVDIADGVKLDLDTQVTYDAAWRMKDQDDFNLAQFNEDDGNRSFDKGDMINNRVRTVIDFDLQYKDFGLFVRPRAFYDWAYDGTNANDSAATNNTTLATGGAIASNEFSKETQDIHRDKVELLDAFAYGEFMAGSVPVSVRVGEQVVSWGESLFLLNGVSSAQGHVDATAANDPAAELKDIFLPSGQVWVQAGVTSNLSVAGYYQWEWEENRFDEAGSYFSTDDYLDNAGLLLVLPGPMMLSRGEDSDPSDSGQYGAAVQYIAEGLNDTEFGFYYINYHEKTPAFDVDFGAGTYALTYAEDVKLYGASFSTVLGGTNVSGEFTFRDGFVVNNPMFAPVKADLIQGQVSIFHFGGAGWFWDDSLLLAEVGFNRVQGMENAELMSDKFAWGGKVKYILKYFQVLNGLDINVPLSYKFSPKGVSSVLGTFNEDDDIASIGMDFTYMNNYTFGITYTDYLNNAKDHKKADRDFLAVKFKYTF